MTDADQDQSSTAALNTRLEEDFVSPLTAVRGSLEVLRDCPDLAEADRRRFIEVALRECARLGRGVERLAETVYADPPTPERTKTAALPESDYRAYCARLAFLGEQDILEIDFSDFLFDQSATVNAFYDVIDEATEATGRKWYLAINFRNCRIWPEAWVAFAHRGKKASVTYAHATVRYAADAAAEAALNDAGASGGADPDILPSRAAAFAKISNYREQAR